MNIVKFLNKEELEEQKDKSEPLKRWKKAVLPNNELIEEFTHQNFKFFLRKFKDHTYMVYEKTSGMSIGTYHNDRESCMKTQKVFIDQKIEQGILPQTVKNRIKERGFINGGENDLPFSLEEEEKIEASQTDLFIINKEQKPSNEKKAEQTVKVLTKKSTTQSTGGGLF